MAACMVVSSNEKELEQKLHLRRTIIFREDDEVETTKDENVLILGLRPSFVIRG